MGSGARRAVERVQPVENRRDGERGLDAALATSRTNEERMRAFVADASHELRTPVSAIGAYAELFDRGAADRPDDLARTMAGIRRESNRVTILINDLMTLATIDDRPAIRQRVDLVALAHDAVDAALAIDDRWPITRHAKPTS